MLRISCGLSIIVTTLVMQASLASETQPAIKAMTFNIRYGSANDGENAWPLRKQMVLDRIRSFQPDVLGLQESLRTQLDFVRDNLPGYSAVGTGRDADGGGEYSPLLYKHDRFDVIASGTFWLSATPEVPGSASWGNHHPRICTWAKLLDRQTGNRIGVLNTHWDHQSQPAREKGSELIVTHVKELAAMPVMVMGDFNSGADNPAIQLLNSAGLRDSYRDVYPKATDVGTYSGFGKRLGKRKIDSVFVSQHWLTQQAEIDRTQPEGRYPSDHFPVTATLELKSE